MILDLFASLRGKKRQPARRTDDKMLSNEKEIDPRDGGSFSSISPDGSSSPRGSLEDSSSSSSKQTSSSTTNKVLHELKTPITDLKPNCLDRITYGNYTSTVWKSFRETLGLNDLLPLHRDYSASYCWDRFYAEWKHTSASLSKPKSDQTDAQQPQPPKEDKKTEMKTTEKPTLEGRGVALSLIRAFWWFIVATSALEIAFDILRLLPVFILSKMIAFVSSTDQPDWIGYCYCGIMFALAIVTSFVLNSLLYLLNCGGVQLRSAMLAALYRKCLVMSNESSQRYTSGDLMNMMSVDVDNVYQFCSMSTLIWGAVVRILTSMAIIWWYLGPSSLAGLAVIVACTPVTVILSNAIARFQSKQMEEKDRRLDILGEILSGIKIIKMYAWEVAFINKVKEIRQREAGFIRKYLVGQALVSFVWYCSPFLVAAVAFGVYVMSSENNILTPEKAFVSLFLFNNMRFSLTFLPMMVTMLLKALVSLDRVQNFLLVSEIRRADITPYVKKGEDIHMVDASFSWGGTSPTLSQLNLTVGTGQLVAIVGKVGSGKSSLLSAILGEMTKLSGSIDVREGQIAYVPQQAWIQNETIRQNILFTSLFDVKWYKRVVKSCCMVPDLMLFPAGDKTEIGEKGVNLSGGQKQRISVARAVYQRAKIYLLDDPLSAVDAHVSSDLFANVIGPKGLLKDCTRILVTHSVAVLPFADRIVILEDGKITHSGTYQEIVKMNIKLKQFLVQPKSKKHKKNDSESEKATSDSLSTGLLERISPRDRSDTTNGDTRGALISEETMEVGSIKWSVYGSLLRHFGVFTAIISLLGFTLYRVGDIFSTMWLSEWSNDGLNLQKRINESQGGVTESPEIVSGKVRELAVHRIAVYLAIGGGEAAAVMIGALAMAVGCLSASTTLHNEMLWAIIRTPMSFFDVTPLGRIINRFGKDIDVLDLELYIHLDGWLDAAFQTAATLLLTCYEIPFFSIVAAPICLAFFVIQKVYMAASRQFRRMQSTTRSPVLNNFSETLHGASSIRAYKAEKHFIEKCQIRIDLNQNCYFHAMVISRWASVRIDWLSSIITSITCALIVFYRQQITPGEAGMVLSYALTICDAISWMIRVATEVENAVVAAERVDEYANVQSEAPWIRKDGPDLDQDWPQQGDVSLVDYSTRYREGMELVLKDINLDVRSGQKVGIVGRTGAGKSSLTLALFRIIEPSYGRIVIDDIDIALLGLHELRSRLTMIPQDPVLFRGNVRTNIDPYNIYTDEQLYTAIERAHLNKEIFLLDYEITHGGTNLSVGERQLLCLARALLRKSKIILLDEATAAVDMETDALIQETIRRDFSSCTIITIAHRLNTVLDYDVIVVLREGRIIEKGSPKQLLADKQSEFHSMAQDAGLII